MTEGEIEKEICHQIAEALEVSPDEISPGSRFFEELGVESIDLLDISFRLERAFLVRMPNSDLLQRSIYRFGEDRLMRPDGRLTEFGFKLFRKAMPEADEGALHADMPASELRFLITPRTFGRVVSRLLAHKAAASRVCSECAGALEESKNTTEFICADCGQVVPLRPGDDVLMDDLAAIAVDLGEPADHAEDSASNGQPG